MIMHGRFVMTHSTTFLAALFATLFIASSAVAEPLRMPADPLGGSSITPPQATPGSIATDPSLTLPAPTETSLGVSSYASPSGPAGAYSSGSGSVYNPTLGAHLRARYNSEGYGQQQGNFDLGTMKLWDVEGGVAFFDGQVTMNDASRVGYNLGLGYRWMTLPLFPNSPDDAKIMGVSVWADGQGVAGDNFFPQVGTSLEFLGDRIDFRANGYAVVGSRSQTRDFTLTGERGFAGNNIAELTLGTRDTALTLGEMEVAGRIQDLDAWVFGGVYSFAGGGFSGTGGKVGLRGYATPDLALSIAITNDPLFDTNAVFGATWFIGRTRRENCPTGTLRDRMREPVIRNDYVTTVQTAVRGIAGIATDDNGDAFRFTHVDSTAGAGGDGTFENPLNSLNDINGNSLDGDIVLAHADSVFTGQSAALRNDQTFVGEGGGNAFSITTSQFGAIDLPESTAGALNGAIPTINASPAAGGVVVALNNTVQNLAFDGGANAIINSATGSENATLRNLTIANMTGDGIFLTTVDGTDTEDLDNDSDTAETINILGNVVIDQVTFTGGQAADIAIDAATTAGGNRGETINITNVTSSTNTGTASIDIRNTNGTVGDQVTIDNYTFNGAGANGALAFDSNEGNISVINSSITGGSGIGVNITNTNNVTSTESISIGSTVTITNVAGTAVNVNGNTGAVGVDAAISSTGGVSGGNVIITDNEGAVTFGGNITTNNVDSVTVTNAQANVNFSGNIDSRGTGNAITIVDAGTNTTDNAELTFSGTVTNAEGSSVLITGGDDLITFNQAITDNGDGIQVSGRLAGTGTDLSRVLFGGQTTLNTTTNPAVTLSGNDDDSMVDFIELDITTTSGTGVFSNGGQFNVTGTGSTITTTTGQALNITGGASTGGVAFASVDTGNAINAINLANFDGTVTVNGGTLTTSGEAVTIADSGLVLNDVEINSTTDQAIGATFTDATARTLTVADMDANGGDFDFVSSGAGGATVSLTDITDGGAVRFLSSGEGNNSLTLSNVTTDDGFDYDVTGAGNLAVTMNTVTGAGNTTLDVTSTGNGQVTMTNVNTGGTIAANSTAGSSGDLVVLVSGSGNTTAFTGITVNDQGGGLADASFSNVTSTSGIDFDSTGAGAATLVVNGGEYGGEINANASNTGNFTADVIGNTELTSGGVVITAANTGTFSSNLNGVDTQEGVTINSTTVGNATIEINGGSYGDAFDIDANNTGTLAFTMQNVAFSTGNNSAAVSLLVGTGVSTGDIDIFNNAGITTGDARAFDLDFNGGDIDFRLNNNTFTNNSAAANTAVIDLAGTTTLDATITNNVFTNSNGAGPAQFLIETSANTPTLNLNISSNTANSGGGNANGEFIIRETAGTIGVFERDDTFNNVGNRNNGNVTFDPNVLIDFADLASEPALPFQQP